MGMLRGTRRALFEERRGGYRLNLDDATFTAGMAKRVGEAGVFDAAPIIQGNWDGTGTPDVVTFPRGDLLGNQAQFFYANFDPYQGSVSFWITPEWDGDDGLYHYFWHPGNGNRFGIYKSSGDDLIVLDPSGGAAVQVDISAWTAGTTYHVVVRWDLRNPLDGTNYYCVSINGVDTFDEANTNTVEDGYILTDIRVGLEHDDTSPADALIEGLCISRVPFYDGAYGCPMWFDETGPIDVIAAIYAAGAGADPAQIFGSWDTTFFLPTDSTPGALATGTGEAWSHPHGSELIDVPFLDDGGLPGTDYAVEFDGAATWVNCNSGATLDDIPSGADMTVAGWVRLDDPSASTFTVVHKGSALATGWGVYVGADGNMYGFVPLADTNMQCYVDHDLGDGKWHYFAFYYDDTSKTGTMSIDGVWGASDTGAGAYQSDAASNLEMGRLTNLSSFWDGGIAWIEISDNDRHTAGTDFVAPRAAYSDGNTVEYWAMDEGTGATAAASVTSPANDGTITDGSWSAIWEVVGTPEIPQSLQFFQENDGIDFGSGANIDDLPSADCTIEFYARLKTPAANFIAFSKANSGGTAGWIIQGRTDGKMRCTLVHAGTSAILDIPGAQDERFHHYAYDWTFATLTLRGFLDGVLIDTRIAVGAYQADAALDCIVNAVQTIGTGDGAFAIGWIRLSDTRRYTGNSFIPAARNNPPANDANAHLLINMDDGAGTTATDSSGNAYHGTITFGATTRWNNTPDLLIDEPGRMIYNQGYNVGSDGANDGIYIPHTLTADTDYVIRCVLQYSPNAWPRITLYDVTGAASVVDFDAPPLSAVHDGGAGAAAFTSTGEVYPASLIGAELYNVTDGSHGTITAVGGTNQDTLTATLAGGGSNDWQVGEQAYIVPIDGWVFNEPTSVHTTANTAYELRVTNRNSDGMITVHQAEALLNLLSHGDHESLTGGNPDLITDWTNNGLDVGDTEAEAAVIHAGAQSLEWNPGAVLGEGQYYAITTTAGKYITFAGWTVGDGSDGFRIGELDGAEALLHNSASLYRVTTSTGAVWTHTPMVLRALDTSPELQIEADAIAGDGFSDDFYALELDDVTLTVTPASEANSAEDTGIRVDGLDSLTVPATAHKMKARSGGLKWRATPRHSLALAQGFGQASEYLLDLTEDANNYLRLVRTTNTLTLAVNQNGAGEVTDTDATAWAADTEVLLEVVNAGSHIYARRDGVTVLDITGLTGFAADFTAAAYFGSEDTPDLQFDGVISSP